MASTSRTSDPGAARGHDRSDQTRFVRYGVAAVGVLCVVFIAVLLGTAVSGTAGGEVLATAVGLAVILVVGAAAVRAVMVEDQRATVRAALMTQAEATASAYRGVEAQRVRYRELLPVHIAAYRERA